MDGIDYNDLFLEAQAELSEVVQEVLEELAMPLAIEALRLRWVTMPDEIKDALRDIRPDIYNMIVPMVSPT